MSVSVSADDLEKAVIAYQARVKVPSLRMGTPKFVDFITAVGARKVPLSYQGGFARVFRWTDANSKERAVRCFFTTPRPDFMARFRDVDHFFRQQMPSATAEFTFHEQGLLIKRGGGSDTVIPIIEMEWVEGDTLVKHVDRLVSQKDIVGLRNLAKRFADLIALMRKVGMAHGDLSGENVMVRHKDSSVVIIDYDGVFIPPFNGLEGDGACNPAFQHPDWQNRPYNTRMDDFSALSIYTAILALVEHPALWASYSAHNPDGTHVGDTLLFHREDYQQPDSATIFQDLLRIPNQEVKRLVQILQDACRKPISEVPDFLALIDPEVEQKAALKRLNDAIRMKDDRQIVALADVKELKGYKPVAEPQIARQVDASRTRMKQAAELDALILSGDKSKMVEVLLRDGFINTNLGRSYAARMKPQLLEQLGKALQTGNIAQVNAIWSIVQLDHEADPYRKAVQRVLQSLGQQQFEAFSRLKRALAKLPRDDAAIVAAWADPLLKKDDPEVKWLETQVRQAQARLDAATKLGGMLGDESKEAEALKLWQEHRLENSIVGEPLRPRIEVIRKQRELLDKIDDALEAGDDEAALLAWGDLLFSDNARAQAYAPKVAAARSRLATVDTLKEALDSGNDKLMMLLWDILKVGELPGGEEYERAVRSRKERWLASRSPRNVMGALDGGELRLTWTWPEDLKRAEVTARMDKFAENAGTNVPGQWSWGISQAQYARQGFARAIAGTPDQLYVRIFPAVPHGADLLYNTYMTPAQLIIKPTRTITYRLRNATNGEHELEVDAHGLRELPPLQVLMSNDPTLKDTSLSPVGLVEEKHRGSDGVYRVMLNLSGWHAPSFLTITPTGTGASQWLKLVPEGGKTIQVA